MDRCIDPMGRRQEFVAETQREGKKGTMATSHKHGRWKGDVERKFVEPVMTMTSQFFYDRLNWFWSFPF